MSGSPGPDLEPAPLARPQPAGRHVLLEVWVVFGLAIVLVRLADHVQIGPAALRGLFPPVIWIYLPIVVLALRGRSPWAYGLDLGDWRGALRDAALTLLLLIPSYLLGHYLFATVIQEHTFRFRLPPNLGNELLGNLLAVGFPEEVFFRGYVLGRLEDALGAGRPLWGGRIGEAVLVSAVLFNLAHPLAGGHWWQGNVPFGLLLAWLRTRRRSLIAPTLVHGVTNVVFRWAELCFVG